MSNAAEAFLAAPDPAKSRTPEELARDLEAVSSAIAALEEQRANLERQLASSYEEPGEYVSTYGEYVVTVRINERWEWDTEGLAEVFGGRILPSYVKQKLSVPKVEFQKLSEDEQRELLPALTRKPSKPIVKVQKKVAS